jgi:hypothetical protein
MAKFVLPAKKTPNFFSQILYSDCHSALSPLIQLYFALLKEGSSIDTDALQYIEKSLKDRVLIEMKKSGWLLTDVKMKVLASKIVRKT